jgi:hypothetical protein
MFINRMFILGVLMVSGDTFNSSAETSQYTLDATVVDNDNNHAQLLVFAGGGEAAVADVEGRKSAMLGSLLAASAA